MDIKEAIKQRHSVRQYKTLPLEAGAKEKLSVLFHLVMERFRVPCINLRLLKNFAVFLRLKDLNGLRLDWKQQFLHLPQ